MSNYITDKKFIENVKNLSNDELLENLDYYADDYSYYKELYIACFNEVRRRLNSLNSFDEGYRKGYDDGYNDGYLCSGEMNNRVGIFVGTDYYGE